MFSVFRRPAFELGYPLGVAVLILGAAGCGPRPMQTQRMDPAPIIQGHAQINDRGELQVQLIGSTICERVIVDIYCTESKNDISNRPQCSETKRQERTERIDPCDVRVQALSVKTPWGQTVTAPVKDGSAALAIDWLSSGIDPMASDIPASVKRPWVITAEGGRNRIDWVPLARDAQAMLTAAGQARGIDVSVDPDARPARVIVKEMAIEGDALIIGQENPLRLTLHNEGPGHAYRVVASTRSSHPELHGLQFQFGRIEAGEEMSRSLTVTLSDAGSEENPMILVFATGANVAEARHNQRVVISEPVKPPPPPLAIECALDGQEGSRTPVVVIGKTAAIRCNVQNMSERALRRVKITATSPHGKAEGNINKRLAPGQQGEAQMQLAIPADALAGSEMALEVSAAADRLTAETTIKIRVEAPQACPDGRITRAEYDEKRARLKELFDQRLLKQQELDRYEAELLRCLE